MTTTETWRPLGYDGREASYDALHDGVPEWMESSFWAWVTTAFGALESYSVSTVTGLIQSRTRPSPRVLNLELLRKAERVLRFTSDHDGTDLKRAVSRLRHVVAIANEGFDLRLADFLLSDGASGPSLDDLLRESSSMWRVGVREGKPGLVRRVPEGAQLHADHVMAKSGQAGKILASAWGEAYGLKPDPSNAYVLAVKAVEEASIPAIVPGVDRATLGTVIRRLEKDGNWSLPLTREHPDARTTSVVLKMCQALWKGHHDRHGGGKHSIPEATQEEAETAVTLAVSLVHWFDSGMVAQR